MLHTTRMKSFALLVAAALLTMAADSGGQDAANIDALRIEMESALNTIRTQLMSSDDSVDARRARQALNRATERVRALAAEQPRPGATRFAREVDTAFEEVVVAAWDMHLAHARAAVQLAERDLNGQLEPLRAQWSARVAEIEGNQGLTADAKQRLLTTASQPVADRERALIAATGSALDGIARRLAAARQTLLDLVTRRVASARAANRAGAANLAAIVEAHLESAGPAAGPLASSLDQLLASARVEAAAIVVRDRPDLGLAARVPPLLAARVTDDVRRAVVYRDPLPRTIWGVLNVSLDHLPEWVPAKLLDPKSAAAAKYRDQTFLFVFGHGLGGAHGSPTGLVVQSDDPAIEYIGTTSEVMRAGLQPAVSAHAELWELGWMWTRLLFTGLDHEFFADLEGVLIRVKTQPQVLKGIKSFSVNGLAGSWALTTTGALAVPSFVRPVPGTVAKQTGASHEWSDTFYIPDTFCVEIETNHPLALAEIPVVLLRDERPVDFGGGDGVLIATRIGPTRYRTAPVQTFAENRPPAMFSAGVKYTYFKPGQTITAVVRHTIGTSTTTSAEARVWLTPQHAGANWKDAVKTAADAAGVTIDRDWDTVTLDVAKTFWSIDYADLWLLTQEAGQPALIAWRKANGQPRFSPNTRPVHLTKVTVGDHAAMILMRRVFIELVTDQIAFYEGLQSAEGLEKAEALIRSLPWQHPLARMEVGPPARSINSDVAIDPSLLRNHTRPRPLRDQINYWLVAGSGGEVRDLVAKALPIHVANLKEALENANSVSETDLPELVKLTGFGFGAVEKSLLPRLMTISRDDGTPLPGWVPEIHGRQHVQGLAYVAQQIKANDKIADASRQLVLAAAALIPMSPGWAPMVRTGLSAALGVADVVDLVVVEGRQQYQNWKEYRFARAAAELLDGERVSRAEVERPSMWGNLAAGMATVVGLKFDAGDALNVVRANIKQRTPALAAKVASSNDPVDAFRRLTPEDQVDLLVASAQAAKKKAAGQSLTPVESQLSDFASVFESDAVTRLTPFRPDKTPGGHVVPPPVPGSGLVRALEGAAEIVRRADPTTLPKGFRINGPNGRTFELGECISKKTAFFAVYEVFEVIDGKPTLLDMVIKIAKKEGDEAVAVINRTVRGAETLHKADIRHARIEPSDVHLDGEYPFFLQKRLHTDRIQMFDDRNVKDWTKAHQVAILELYQELGRKNILWYDGHFKNVYFETDASGKLKAGILDSDFLHGFSESAGDKFLANRLTMIEWFPHLQGIQSMNGARKPPFDRAADSFEVGNTKRLYPNAMLFMEKMLEHRGWIKFDLDTNTWKSTNLMDIDLVDDYFKGFRDRVGVDLSGGTPQAEVLPGWLPLAA